MVYMTSARDGWLPIASALLILETIDAATQYSMEVPHHAAAGQWQIAAYILLIVLLLIRREATHRYDR